MRIVRPGSVVGPQQQYMYLQQLEWAKWSALDEQKRNVDAARAAASGKVTPTASSELPMTPPGGLDEEDLAMVVDASSSSSDKAPSTPTKDRIILPPVTPSRHVAAANAKAGAIEPPGQPRKTPTAKRTISAREAESDGSDEERDILPPLDLQPKTRAGARRVGARDGSATDPPRTRSTGAATASTSRRAGPPPASPVKGGPGPNKIPRLAATKTARAAAGVVAAPPKSPSKPRTKTVPATTSRARLNPPTSPIPSRLPTLAGASTKKGPNLRDLAKGTVPKTSSRLAKAREEKKGDQDKWMTANPKAVVTVPVSKKVDGKDRPVVRTTRRRRSSFSSADVVA